MKTFYKLILLVLLAATSAIAMPVNGQSAVRQGPGYTLYPPLSFQGSAIECFAYLTWQKPQLPNGSTPDGLVGYNIYRNGTMIHYIASGDILSFYDYDTYTSWFDYTITAQYDLTSYGFPGQFEASPPAGPVSVGIDCPVSLPFSEPWDQGTFSFQNWMFVPSQGNWTMNTSQGNPLPAAFFNGSPTRQNYNFTMKSMWLPGEVWVCADMFLEFDYKLTDVAANGTEKLIAGYFLDTTWTAVLELKNQGSTGWLHQQIEISQVKGHQFKIGFKATGANSANLGSWAIDNIFVNPVCMGPLNCGATRNANVVHLFWEHPCGDSIMLVMPGYNIYRSQGSPFGPFTKLNASLVADIEYFDNLPIPVPYDSLKYIITLVQCDPVNFLPLCEAACDTLTVDMGVGIPSTHPSGLSIFPNPASDFIQVKSDIPVKSCELLNGLGNQIIYFSITNQKEIAIPVSGIVNGIYFLKVITAKSKTLSKIAVIH